MESKDQDVTGTLEPFQKWRVTVQEDAEAPSTAPYCKRPSSKAHQAKPAPPALPQISPPPLPHHSLTKPQIRETDLSSASCLLVWLLCHRKLFLSAKDHRLRICSFCRMDSKPTQWVTRADYGDRTQAACCLTSNLVSESCWAQILSFLGSS